MNSSEIRNNIKNSVTAIFENAEEAKMVCRFVDREIKKASEHGYQIKGLVFGMTENGIRFSLYPDNEIVGNRMIADESGNVSVVGK